MPKLLFFSRVAFLCNICFLISICLHYIPAIANGMVSSTIIVLGTVLSIVINALTNVLCILVTLAGKPIRLFVPKWLIIINFLFFILQVILLIK
jgi:hypothetical protein